MTTQTPCQEYGHCYKTVWDFSATFERVFRVCDDCGDEYEITDEIFGER